MPAVRILSVAVTVLMLAFVPAALAAEPVVATTIKVSDMDCPSCAKKLATKLSAVPGVAKVETNVNTGVVKITPKSNAKVSSRALWEAVMAVKFTPEQLKGPDGTFKSKPPA